MYCLPVWVLLLSLLSLIFPGWKLHNVNGKMAMCKLPDMFEGRLSGTTTNKFAFGFSSKVFWKGTVHVDTLRDRIAIYAKFDKDGQQVERNAFVSKTSRFMVLPESAQCIMDPMETPIIPEDIMDVTLGRRKGVPVQIWNSPELEDWEEGTQMKIYVTQDACLPVSFDVDIKTIGEDRVHSYTESFSATLSNMKKGVKDMSVFDLPDYCPQNTIYQKLGEVDQVIHLNPYKDLYKDLPYKDSPYQDLGEDDEGDDDVVEDNELYDYNQYEDDESQSTQHDQGAKKNYTSHIYKQQQAFVWE